MDTDTVAMMGMIMGSRITIFAATLWQTNRHEDSIKALDTKLDKEFKAVHGEFKAVRREMAAQGERLARIEGHLLGPESFSPRPPSPPPAEPADDERQTGRAPPASV